MKKELEKSLKRYLKRKVRITLGFVTAFAIMGNVGLANSTTDYELAEKYLNGIENTKLDEKSTVVGRDIMSHGSYIFCSSFSFVHC